jgi:protein tyrosine phosphatase (PTP) superfamily phosphohydrolase (DUF442 family)
MTFSSSSEAESTPERRVKIVLRKAALLFTLSILVVGGCVGCVRFSGNFHTVEDGVLYRSAQLSLEQFRERIKANGIKTIINLRGSNPGERWYADELDASKKANVHHIDFPLSAIREVSDEKIARLIELLRDSPRPILIHCEGGADRTGLASALFELFLENRPASSARTQLSLRFGHFPWLGNRTIAMDKSFDRVATERPSRLSPSPSP